MKESVFFLVDCNSFFVSCERLFRPDLQDKPVIVLSGNDGCCVSRSYEAKAAGIPMGAPLFEFRDTAKKAGVHIFSSNFELYGDLSRRVMETLKRFCPDLEVYSIDEAFLEFPLDSPELLTALAQEIRATVLQWVGIPVSIGIAPTKTLAKAASHLAKQQPHSGGVWTMVGQTPEERHTALTTIPVGEVWGIGWSLTDRLHEKRIWSAADLCQCSDAWILQELNRPGLMTVWELRGQRVEEEREERVGRKSIIHTRSFGTPLTSVSDLCLTVANFTASAGEKLRHQKSRVRHIRVSLHPTQAEKRKGKKNVSHSVLLSSPIQATPDLIRVTTELCTQLAQPNTAYRKAGVYLSCFESESHWQPSLLDSTDHSRQKRESLNALVDHFNRTRNETLLTYAATGTRTPWQRKADLRSPRATTKWAELPQVKL